MSDGSTQFNYFYQTAENVYNGWHCKNSIKKVEGIDGSLLNWWIDHYQYIVYTHRAKANSRDEFVYCDYRPACWGKCTNRENEKDAETDKVMRACIPLAIKQTHIESEREKERGEQIKWGRHLAYKVLYPPHRKWTGLWNTYSCKPSANRQPIHTLARPLNSNTHMLISSGWSHTGSVCQLVSGFYWWHTSLYLGICLAHDSITLHHRTIFITS